MGLRRIGLPPNSCLKMFDGLFVSAFSGGDGSQFVMSLSVTGIELQRPLIITDSLIGFAAGEHSQADASQRWRIIGFDTKGIEVISQRLVGLPPVVEIHPKVQPCYIVIVCDAQRVREQLFAIGPGLDLKPGAG